MQEINWTNTYRGQSPGDLENKKNGFAGRFSGFDNRLKNPIDYIKTTLPTILIIGDSIIGDYCCSFIRHELNNTAKISILQQPHHCKNIMSWLDTWRVEEWKYDIIFCFDGMHGFPYRVTEEEHLKLTPLVMNRLKTVTNNILWANCIPVSDKYPQGNKNSTNGPNTIEQIITNTSVINRNKSIKTVTEINNITLIDLYSLIKPIQDKVQPNHNNVHLNPQGQMIMGNHIVKHLKNMINNVKS